MSALVRHHLPRRVTITMLCDLTAPLALLAACAGSFGLAPPLDAGALTPLLGLLLLLARPAAGADWALVAACSVAAMAGCAAWAAAARLVVLHLFNHGAHYGRILVVGDRRCVPHLVREVRRAHGSSLRLVGLVDCPGCPAAIDTPGLPLLGPVDRLGEIVATHRIDTVIMSLRTGEPGLRLETLAACRLAGVEFIDSSEFYETTCHKLLLEREEAVRSLAFGSHRVTRWHWRLKSAGENLLAAILLLLLAVPAAAVAATIALTSPGGAIYRQTRVGRGGVPFTMYKFRTMQAGAENASGPVWSRPNDPRTTRIGRILRRTRFDEVPQLWNILRGEMAFVGPRPERPAFVSELEEALPAYRYRHLVKPGLTGWAQVNAGYGSSLADAREKLRFDLYYVKNMSLALDLVILAATAQAVLGGEGV